MNENGRLYLCATPIGNLGDITYRAVEMLRAADLIAAEDTRHTRGLLAHYDIHTPMTSYHEHNKDSKGPELIARMQAGETIVCVSDAGLPGIADPGGDLARRAITAGILVTPLPGANAALSALICAKDSPSSAFSRARKRNGANCWHASPPTPRRSSSTRRRTVCVRRLTLSQRALAERGRRALRAN